MGSLRVLDQQEPDPVPGGVRPWLLPLHGRPRGALRRCLPPIGAFAAAFAVTVAASGREPAPRATVVRDTAAPARTWSSATLRTVDALPHLRRDPRPQTTTRRATRGGGDPIAAAVVEPAPVTAAAPPAAEPHATAPPATSATPPAPATPPPAPKTAPAVVQPAPRHASPPASSPAPAQPEPTFDSSGSFDSAG